MADDAEFRAEQRRADRAALGGVVVMALALLLSSYDLVPRMLTTVAGLAGLGLLMYAVHVVWMVFYDREPDGPSS